MLNPVPAVMVSCADKEGRANVMTAAWAGTICSDPVMVSVSIRKERYSYQIIKDTKEFVINLTTASLAKATDYVGVRSGRNIDKFALEGDLRLTKQPSKCVKVKDIIELGTHDMFIGEVVCTSVDDAYLDENGRLDLQKADLIAYSHGEYYRLGQKIGKFGFSVQKKKRKKRK